MNTYNLGKDRMLCWDDFLIDKIDGAEIRQHKPERRNKILEGVKLWEGNYSSYNSIIKTPEGKIRFYYRTQGGNQEVLPDGRYLSGTHGRYCVAESTDGKNFKRMPINKHEFNGITHNNIYFNQGRDNFAVCYDENPNCPENERYKALAMGNKEHYPDDNGGHGLYLFVSGNGIDFENRGKLDIPGSFDSYNTMLWDKETEQYYVFHRSEYRTDGFAIEFDIVKKEREIFRTINVSTSKDMVHFEHLGELNYGDEHIPVQFYTNNIVKYYRAKDMFLGIPTRYNDRWEDPDNFKQMPLSEYHELKHKYYGREGTVVTDCSLLTSRDGYHFNKWEESYLTGGIEADGNWFYGDCYVCYGLYETEADKEGEPNEISFIVPKKDVYGVAQWWRYATRLDGFISWYSKFNLGKGGEILTKPFTFEGNELEVNFSSSAMGDMVITVCDEEGNELEGYKTYRMFGDSVCRLAEFEKDLSALAGKPIRLKFNLRDTDIYSFKFN